MRSLIIRACFHEACPCVSAELHPEQVRNVEASEVSSPAGDRPIADQVLIEMILSLPKRPETPEASAAGNSLCFRAEASV